MDAMAFGRAKAQLSALWQFPLLVISLALFGYAAYRFIDPKPGPTLAQRIDACRALVDGERFDPAITLCNKLLNEAKLTPEQAAGLHILLGEALDAAQTQKKLSIPINYRLIVQQTEMGLQMGQPPTAQIWQRLGRCHEAVEEIPEALEAYQHAIALDNEGTLALQRHVIDLQLARPDQALAEDSILAYLKNPKLSGAERAWALSHRAKVLAQKGNFKKAHEILDGALTVDSSAASHGVVHYWMGYCEFKEQDQAEAERTLRVARDELGIGNPLDADAAFLLGRIRQDNSDPRQAISFYEAILISHPEWPSIPLAWVGRGECRIMLKQLDGGLNDLHDAVKDVVDKPQNQNLVPDMVQALKHTSTALAAGGQNAQALEVMTLEQTLVPEPAPEFFSRLAALLEQRADQLDHQALADPAAPESSAAQTASPPVAGAADTLPRTVADRDDQARAIRKEAGDAYLALAQELTLVDDRGQSDAIWKAVDLYDRAGAIAQTIAALEFFVSQHPNTGQTPEALLRLGRAYQATGQFDKAVETFQKTQIRFSESLAASKSGVPLAQALIARGPDFYAQAERVLRALIENNPVVTPDAEEFRLALFELSQLYYRTGRYEDAIARLEETTQRYPNDPRLSQLYFVMADSYRKSAALLASSAADPKAATATGTGAARAAAAQSARGASSDGASSAGASSAGASSPSAPLAPPAPQGGVAAADAATPSPDSPATAAARAEAAAARRDRLAKARALFEKVVERNRGDSPQHDIDKLQLKLSHLYRADCAFDLGEYEEAIRLYDAAALRYQDDPMSVAAYIQIANGYCALGRLDDARTANERAKWLLRRMPESAFEEAKNSMPKEYWENWLKNSGESGLYSRAQRSEPLSDAR